MITKAQRKNAERIKELSIAFGNLAYDKHGQTMNQVLNLSIPCADLIVTGVVTGVADTSDGVNDNAVWDVERVALLAVEYNTRAHGHGWWNETAEALLTKSAINDDNWTLEMRERLGAL